MTKITYTREAFEACVQPHLGALLRLARRLMRDPQDAEDLLQDTCLKAFRAFAQFQPGSDARAWLMTILINTYRDWVRKTLRAPQSLQFDTVADGYQPSRWPALHTPAVDPETATIRANLTQVVRMAIDDLPPEFRLAVLLADVQGYAYKEAADILGCPIGTVMSRLHRGRQLLYTTLRAFLEE